MIGGLISMYANTREKNVKQGPPILDLPVGTRATGNRKETDSLGEVEVQADHYWGAQTQRSLIHFSIGDDHMPKEVYHAYGYVKKAAALVNADAGRLPRWKADVIARVADEVIAGFHISQHHIPHYFCL
jgi:fumarate hydratase class II